MMLSLPLYYTLPHTIRTLVHSQCPIHTVEYHVSTLETLLNHRSWLPPAADVNMALRPPTHTLPIQTFFTRFIHTAPFTRSSTTLLRLKLSTTAADFLRPPMSTRYYALPLTPPCSLSPHGFIHTAPFTETKIHRPKTGAHANNTLYK